VLLGRREREEEQARAWDTAAMRWQPGGAWVGMARTREGQEGGARAVAGVQVTRGVARSWRWRRGTAEARHMAGEAAASDMKQSRAECQRKKKRGGGPRDLLGICKNLMDLTVN
jgi:hypothetical protein